MLASLLKTIQYIFIEVLRLMTRCFGGLPEKSVESLMNLPFGQRSDSQCSFR